MPSLTGVFRHLHSTNYNEYLESAGYEFYYRNVFANANPVIEITNEEDNWTIKNFYGFTSSATRFRLGEAFIKTCRDERTCNCVYTQEGNDSLVLVKIHTAGNLTSRIVSQFANTVMKMTLQGPGNTVATRIFERIEHVPDDML